jgi:hypothetical protein
VSIRSNVSSASSFPENGASKVRVISAGVEAQLEGERSAA